MIKSVYTEDGGIVLSSIPYLGFVLQQEDVAGVILNVAYTASGEYIGSKEIAEFLHREGISQCVQPLVDGTSCSIGYNPKAKRWFGWSHRGFASFGIGSKVRKGDIAFSPRNPRNPKELEEAMLSFWDLEGAYVWRECENEQTVCKNVLYRSCQTRQDGVLGWCVAYKTIFIGADREFTKVRFTPYPKHWGKGEFTVETLQEAKQVAIDYARGIS